MAKGMTDKAVGQFDPATSDFWLHVRLNVAKT